MLTTLTERGQVSVPAELRRVAALKPGQTLSWDKISDREFRVTVLGGPRDINPRAALGMARSLSKHTTTAAWMRVLRAGER